MAGFLDLIRPDLAPLLQRTATAPASPETLAINRAFARPTGAALRRLAPVTRRPAIQPPPPGAKPPTPAVQPMPPAASPTLARPAILPPVRSLISALPVAGDAPAPTGTKVTALPAASKLLVNPKNPSQISPAVTPAITPKAPAPLAPTPSAARSAMLAQAAAQKAAATAPDAPAAAGTVHSDLASKNGQPAPTPAQLVAAQARDTALAAGKPTAPLPAAQPPARPATALAPVTPPPATPAQPGGPAIVPPAPPPPAGAGGPVIPPPPMPPSGGAGGPVTGTAGPAAVSPFAPGADLRFQKISPEASARLASLEGYTDQAAQGLLTTPDRTALAKQTFDALRDESEPQYQKDLRDVGEKAAALGRVGAGMTTSELGDVTLNRERYLGDVEQGLAAQAAGESLNDQLARVSGLAGLEGQEFGQEAEQRGELRGERGYEYGVGQDAQQSAVQQAALQDSLLSSEFGRAGQEAALDLTGAGQYDAQAAADQGGAGALLSQYALLQSLGVDPTAYLRYLPAGTAYSGTPAPANTG